MELKMKELISKVEVILKNKGFRRTAKVYCSTVNGVFFVVRLDVNKTENKVYVSLSLIKDSYFDIYLHVRGIENVNVSSKDKILGPHRRGLLSIYEELFLVNKDTSEQQIVDTIILKIEIMVAKYSGSDINDLIIRGKYKPYYKAFALIDSCRIDDAIALCKECVSKDVVDLYVDNAGHSIYQHIIDMYSTEQSTKVSDKQVRPITDTNKDDVLLDSVEWHYKSAEEKYCLTHNVLPELLTDGEIIAINRLAGYHIGVFFHWLVDQDFVSNVHKESNSSELKEVLEYKRLGVDYLNDYCGGKLIKEDICDEFADALFDFYVKDGGYLNLYANYIRYEIHMNEYCGTLTAEEFKVFEHVLNENAGLR